MFGYLGFSPYIYSKLTFMKKSQLKQIIKEEIKNSLLRENNLTEDVGLRIGEKYDIKDYGDGEFRDDMEYLGYSRNENAHMFRGFGAPGSNDIDIMYVEKGSEAESIR